MSLARKQLQAVSLVTQGMINREIAVVMGTTENMVKNYLRQAMDKLGLWNRVELALWYTKETFSGYVAENHYYGA